MKKNKIINFEGIFENLKEISKFGSGWVTKENRLRFYELRDYLRPYFFLHRISGTVLVLVLSLVAMSLVYVVFELNLVVNNTQVLPVGYKLSKEWQGVIFWLSTVALFRALFRPFDYLWVKLIYRKIKKWSEKSDFNHAKPYEEELNSKREAIALLFTRIDNKNFRQPDIKGIEKILDEGAELFQKRHSESLKEQAEFLRNGVGISVVD